MPDPAHQIMTPFERPSQGLLSPREPIKDRCVVEGPSEGPSARARLGLGKEALGLLNRLAATPGAMLLVSVFVALTFLTIPRYTLATDVESAWSSVLDYAHETGLQSGTEIVFPYGPLGFLLISHFTAHTGALRLVFDCLLCFGISGGVCLLAWRFQPGWRLLTIAAFTLVAANKQYGAQDLLLDIGLLSWGLLCLTESGPRLVLYAVVLVFLAAFSALAKVTFLFSAGLTVCVVSLDLALRGKRWLGLATAVGFLAGAFLLWGIMGQKLSNLPTFFERTLALCTGYEQTMALQPRGIVLAGGILVTLLASALVVLRCMTGFDCKDASARRRRWLALAWLLSLLFLSWKHGFVRGDRHHNYLFLGLMAVFVLLLEALPHADGRVRPWTYGLAGLGSILAVASLQISLYPKSLQLDRCFSQVVPNVESLLHPVAYREQMNQWLSQARRETELPGVRKAIGPASVDVFGNYQTYAILNHLNYRPRPVFQSYSAYNAPLSQLNEDFYLSPQAPQYVLATLEPIDQRFPPLEDALLFRDLLINYNLSGIEGGFLLLQSRSRERPRLIMLSEGTVGPGQRINLNSVGEANIWLQINVEPAPGGRIRQHLYQLPRIHLRVWCPAPAKSPGEFCAPAPMMATGFVASPLLASDTDMLALYSGEPVTRPAAYSVELGSSASLWKSTIRFRIYRIENSFGGRALSHAGKSSTVP